MKDSGRIGTIESTMWGTYGLTALMQQAWSLHRSAPGYGCISSGCQLGVLIGLLIVRAEVALTLLPNFKTLFLLFDCLT